MKRQILILGLLIAQSTVMNAGTIVKIKNLTDNPVSIIPASSFITLDAATEKKIAEIDPHSEIEVSLPFTEKDKEAAAYIVVVNGVGTYTISHAFGDYYKQSDNPYYISENGKPMKEENSKTSRKQYVGKYTDKIVLTINPPLQGGVNMWGIE